MNSFHYNQDPLYDAAAAILQGEQFEPEDESLSEAKSLAFSVKELKVFEGMLLKYIRKSEINSAIADIAKAIDKWISIAPNDGTISVNYGFTEVMESPKELKIQHSGTHNVMKYVDENLKSLKYPSIEQLKKMFPKFTESNSPGYSYTIIFKKTKGAEFIGKQYL